MSRNILIAFCLIVSSIESSSIGMRFSTLDQEFKSFLVESCTTLAGESGDCVFLHKCPVLLDAFRRDRNNAPTVCHRESRKICCPLKYLAQPETADNENDLDSRASIPDKDRNESRVFDGPEIERRKFSIQFTSESENKFVYLFQSALSSEVCCSTTKPHTRSFLASSQKSSPRRSAIKTKRIMD